LDDLPNGKALIPAPIDEDVWRKVTQAMLEKQQLMVKYRSRSQNKVQKHHLHPIGLVSRYSISYLVAMVDGYDNYRQFALHRILSASVVDQPSLSAENFDIDAYINQGTFGIMNEKTESTVMLIADISPSTAWLLSETPLSHNQRIKPIEGTDWQRLEAVVPNNQEMLWWIFAMNTEIRVHEPQNWMEAVKKTIDGLAALYS
jgi:predicted DNA-binding transcriptional regulator YafY